LILEMLPEPQSAKFLIELRKYKDREQILKAHGLFLELI